MLFDLFSMIREGLKLRLFLCCPITWLFVLFTPFAYDPMLLVCTAFKRLSKLEGIIPALETSHAIAYLEKLCPTLPDGAKVVLNCSGRGDKDVQTVINHLKF